ncbi:endonuclease-reverse transcriptase [Plakobranchus ocellatus]|uniref:Endonuclease-reverse transcriptase n=1 Tax=Plakobranchus ocellatus TaxID=259542 RepID=A0AAV3ZYU5_9GAST|nr:endonuclease-reverse transcriptase [Plakobranchus ocellatus]
MYWEQTAAMRIENKTSTFQDIKRGVRQGCVLSPDLFSLYRKFEGKRSRGRQREKIMNGLVTWLGTGKVLDTLAAVKDRDLWRDMIANAYKQGT